MIHCTDLIRALELYCRGYGDRNSIDQVLALARRNQEDSRVFAWQRQRLGELIARVESTFEDTVEEDALLAAPALRPLLPGSASDAGLR